MISYFKSILSLICLIVLVILVRVYVATPIAVQGESMMPTLVDGEKAISYKLGEINRFDIIPFIATDDPSLNYVKRVIGLPGDMVSYQDDVLYINGVATDEPYLDDYKNKWKASGNTDPLTPNFTLQELTGEQTVPPNEYFVLGDNRQVSKDSRLTEVGFIPKKNILGRVKFVIWPIKNWGALN